MADNENNEKACELIRNIIDERPAQIEYFNSLSRDQLLETLDLEMMGCPCRWNSNRAEKVLTPIVYRIG